jgi:hypothetical protein
MQTIATPKFKSFGSVVVHLSEFDPYYSSGSALPPSPIKYNTHTGEPERILRETFELVPYSFSRDAPSGQRFKRITYSDSPVDPSWLPETAQEIVFHVFQEKVQFSANRIDWILDVFNRLEYRQEFNIVVTIGKVIAGNMMIYKATTKSPMEISFEARGIDFDGLAFMRAKYEDLFEIGKFWINGTLPGSLKSEVRAALELSSSNFLKRQAKNSLVIAHTGLHGVNRFTRRYHLSSIPVEVSGKLTSREKAEGEGEDVEFFLYAPASKYLERIERLHRR